MKKIKLQQLQLSDRLIFESIRQQLVKSNKRIHSRNDNTPEHQSNTLIYRSQRKKTEPQIIRQSNNNNHEEVSKRYFSIDLNFKRCKTLQYEERKKIRSRVQEQMRSEHDQSFDLVGGQNKKRMMRVGPLIFIKDMLTQTQSQPPKKLRMPKLKSAKSQSRIREEQPTEDLSVTPLKISIDLPKIQRNSSLLLKHENNNVLKSVKKALQKSKKKKYQKYNFNNLSPWATKGQNFSPLEQLR